jgi:hypothetical protein
LFSGVPAAVLQPRLEPDRIPRSGIWHVDKFADAPDLGRLATPFNSLQDF